jgi:hypothetical protein
MGLATNPAIQRISQMLADAFLEHGEKIRQELLASYRAGAKRQYENFMAAIQSPENVGELYDYRDRHPRFRDWHEYTDFDGGAAKAEWAKVRPRGVGFDPLDPYNGIRTWEQARRWVHLLKLDYTRAVRDANAAYENARDSFVTKNVQKMGNVLGGRTDLVTAEVKCRWRSGVFEGGMDVVLSDATFVAEVGLKYVVRHVPRTTPYFQYPMLFVTATVKGVVHRAPSEDELRVLLGGVSTKVLEKQREAEKAEAGFCQMGGQHVPEALLKGKYRMTYVYAVCPSCGGNTSVDTRSWKFRKHKTPGAERAGAAKKLETAGYCSMSREKVPAHIVAAMGPVEGYKDPKGPCEACGQQVRLDAESDWIRRPGWPEERSTHMRVTSAKYYKHKLP